MHNQLIYGVRSTNIMVLMLAQNKVQKLCIVILRLICFCIIYILIAFYLFLTHNEICFKTSV